MPDPPEILFGGAVSGTTQKVQVADPSGQLKWFQVFEKAFLQLASTPEGRLEYGDPEKGATLEQAWRAQFAITGMFQVCLLASGRLTTATGDIPKTVLLAPATLVDYCARMLAKPRTAFQIFVHDGRMGHSVTLMTYDAPTDSFHYHDPWPGRSLLCKEQNAAGVDAQPSPDGSWRITRAELASVIFATFAWPAAWADLMGIEYAIPYTEFRGSEFWSFFHITEAMHEAKPEGGMTIELKTGGFREEINLQVEIDGDERLRDGQLVLSRAWITGPPFGINPFGVDIAKSYIGALTPAPDAESSRPLVDAIWHVRDQERTKALVDPAARALVMAYLGMQRESTAFMTYSQLSATNLEHEGKGYLRLQMQLY